MKCAKQNTQHLPRKPLRTRTQTANKTVKNCYNAKNKNLALQKLTFESCPNNYWPCCRARPDYSGPVCSRSAPAPNYRHYRGRQYCYCSSKRQSDAGYSRRAVRRHFANRGSGWASSRPRTRGQLSGGRGGTGTGRVTRAGWDSRKTGGCRCTGGSGRISLESERFKSRKIM